MRKSSGRVQQPESRAVRPTRRDGRDPMDLGDVLRALVTERAWELPAAGATLRERWAASAPELAGHVAFDADSGRLTVRPESEAWATKTRLEQARVIEAASESAGHTVVRALKILAPGTVSTRKSTDAEPEPAAALAGSVRKREPASDGYRAESLRPSAALDADLLDRGPFSHTGFPARAFLPGPTAGVATRAARVAPLDGSCTDNYGVNTCSIWGVFRIGYEHRQSRSSLPATRRRKASLDSTPQEGISERP
ncbi:DUF721 domain-containing protein [Streptomyces tibetensis]|uniref:DUF721 domain-containing protein n=1 Tax=Streptomyces tibetensis TaxID=2382123 RepID=A0ABW6N8Y2_9ACTN